MNGQRNFRFGIHPIEGQQRFSFRFGITALLVAIALLAVLFAFWNPFQKQPPSITDFQDLRPGTSDEQVTEIFGRPAQEVKTEAGHFWIYNADVGRVFLYFEDGKYTGLNADRWFPPGPSGI
jgi:hypothetical protein